jgi:hypothetical protein
MFFKKQKIPTVTFYTPSAFWHAHFSEIVVPAKNCMPAWWSKDNTRPSALRRFAQCWQDQGFIKEPKYASNINRCPGFADQFENSWLLCAPCDIVLNITGDENWKFFAAIPNFNINQHLSAESAGLFEFKQKQNLKFEYPYDIRTATGTVDLMYIPAVWHTNYNEFGNMEVLPGQMTVNPTFALPLNLNTLVTKEKSFVAIKRGTVLAQLRFSKSVQIKVELSNDESASSWTGLFDRATDYKQHCKNHRGDNNDS